MANAGAIGAGIACIIVGFILQAIPMQQYKTFYGIPYGVETVYPFASIGFIVIIIGFICIVAGAVAGGEKKVAPPTVPSPRPAPTPAGKVYCPSCGAENPAEAAYCHACGNRLRS